MIPIRPPFTRESALAKVQDGEGARNSREGVATTLHVAGLWRYPVKTLAGERLSAAVIGPDGIRGDRIVRVRGHEGVRTARRHYRLLGLRGTLGPDDRPRINGHPWDGPLRS